MQYLKTYESFNKRNNCIEYILKSQSVTDGQAYRKDQLVSMDQHVLVVLCDEVRAFKSLVGVHYNFPNNRPSQAGMTCDVPA